VPVEPVIKMGFAILGSFPVACRTGGNLWSAVTRSPLW
jgi:hypothetical protein